MAAYDACRCNIGPQTLTFADTEVSPVLSRHEIVGIVTEVGKNAEGHFTLGDRAGAILLPKLYKNALLLLTTCTHVDASDKQ